MGVEPGASAAAVRSAWRRLAKSAHPDAGGDVDRMRQLNAALTAALSHAPAPAVEGFSIDVLPVVACEHVVMAVASLGEVLSVDEPYRVEGWLAEPAPCFVAIDLVPEAGGSIVTVEVGPPFDDDAADAPAVGAVVEALVAALR